VSLSLRPAALILATALLACTADHAPPAPCSDGYPAGAARPAGCDPGADWLAFTYAGPGASTPAVFIGKSDGTCLQRLTTDTAYSGDPAFFPGGRKLVYSSTRSGLNQLYVRDLVTGAETRLETSYTFAPPTGTLTLNAAMASVSPDGATIAFEGRVVDFPRWSDIFTIPSSGGTVARVTNDPAAATQPRWSPDGARLYFISRQAGAEIRSIAPDGAGEAPVTAGSALASRFDLSADGQSLAYARHSTTGAGPQPTELVAFDLATSTVRVVSSSNEADPALDAAGASVAVSRRNAASGYDLFLIDYATGAVKRQLTSCPGQAFGAVFAR
jgi:Tol biopolymer transport system component